MASSSQRPRPLSADFSPRKKQDSMLYSMLPSAVQARLPRLPSLRRSVSLYGLASCQKNDSRPGTGSRTPNMAMVLSGARATEDLGYEIDPLSSDDDIATSRSAGKGRQTVELTESRSGIGWKFANQGLNLLSLAVEESSTLSQEPQFGNPSFARQLYLHALTYLLRALPPDLTTEEQLSVRSALPAGVVQPLQVNVNNGYPFPETTLPTHSSAPPSLLHRTLASTIVQIFIIMQFLLPYLKYLLSAAYTYEREHRISEKVFSQSIDTVDTIGRRTLSFTEAIYGMGDGKVGQVLSSAACWFVEGVTGGIHEGVGEGMVVIGARRPATELEKRS